MTQNISGRALGAANLHRFQTWIEEREAASDWTDYIHGDKLSRSEIAAECGFALSVVRQNPAVKEALAALEERLRADGILRESRNPMPAASASADEATGQAIERRILIAKNKAEQRVKDLEEQNIVLRAEISDLREQLARFRHLDEHLCTTGRLLHP